MNTERIEVAHNKKATLLICLWFLILVAGLAACITVIGVNFALVTSEIGMAATIAILTATSLCALFFVIVLINRLIKLRRKIIFVADEKGICDYSRFIVLKPISYGEIADIEYKEFMDESIEASEIRHIKIILKDKRGYMKKLNFLQKFSLLIEFSPIELHLFGGKTKLKVLAEKLKQNLNSYNRSTDI